MLTPTTILLPLLAALPLATAHFKISSPTWRADSLSSPSASQWNWPCANISELPSDHVNRTHWNPEHGQLALEVHHPWALTYVNLGLGMNVSAFNVSLIGDGKGGSQGAYNQTGNGTFCLKDLGERVKWGLEMAGLKQEDANGMRASIQVIQISTTGAALYNCADVILNTTAPLLSDSECKNSTNVGGVFMQNEDLAAAQNGGNGSAEAGDDKKGAAARVGGGVGAILTTLVAAVGVAML